VALEGLDGAGKSTQARLLKENLARLGYGGALILNEPTSGYVGARVRSLFFQNEGLREPQKELNLFLEDRALDVKENLLPALSEGITVIMDRYILSNVAYQGALQELDNADSKALSPEEILAANQIFPWPDLTFLLEVDLEVSLERTTLRGGRDPIFEKDSYLRKVKAIYDIIGQPNLPCPGLTRLNADIGESALANSILSRVQRCLDLSCPFTKVNV
jgi:dTMP kinase